MADILARLNQITELDFVLITGDLFDQADQTELEQFQQVIRTLTKPYYIIPGNHDRRPPTRVEGLTRRQFAGYFNPQVADRPVASEAQAGYWSIAVHPQVQLIGLDSIRDENWGGVIDAAQVAWLTRELAAHADKLVILAIHHPLHSLAPIDQHPDWLYFVCDSGPELLHLLDQFPQVKLVLTGHHHMTRVDKLGRRLHFACPSIAGYPCAYRTFRLTRRADQTWQCDWQTQPATDEAAIAEAHGLMLKGWQAIGFAADFVEQYILLSLGSDDDRNGSAIL